jgi:CysZ protein
VVTFDAVKRAALGFSVAFFRGVRALFGGLWFIVSTPSTWGWALIPALLAGLLFGGGAAVAIWGADQLSDLLVLRIVLWAIGLVVAFVLAISLAQPLSGFALDAIARKQELALGGRVWPSQPTLTTAARSLRVSLTALALGLPVLALLAVVTFLFPPVAVVTVPLKFLVTGMLAAYDLLDYPLSQRGRSVADRLVFIRSNFPAVLGFGAATAAVLLVPGVGLLLLPFGVAGATRMVMQAERQARQARLDRP